MVLEIMYEPRKDIFTAQQYSLGRNHLCFTQDKPNRRDLLMLTRSYNIHSYTKTIV